MVLYIQMLLQIKWKKTKIEVPKSFLLPPKNPSSRVDIKSWKKGRSFRPSKGLKQKWRALPLLPHHPQIPPCSSSNQMLGDQPPATCSSSIASVSTETTTRWSRAVAMVTTGACAPGRKCSRHRSRRAP
jgi:hypothetical protein